MRKRLPLLLVFLLLSALTPHSAHSIEMKRYIIKVDPGYRAAIENSFTRAGGTVSERFSSIFSGFVVELPAIPILSRSLSNRIQIIQEDIPIRLSQSTQSSAPWALDRIDQRALPLSNSFTYKNGGAGSTIYIVDSGIADHDDFGERVSNVGFTAFSDGRGFRDCQGHGTHVASLAAGNNYGVAKNATLVSVRVFECSDSTTLSAILNGLDWILSNSNTNSKSKAVVNMSLGTNSTVTLLDQAVAKIVDAGIPVVVAAGNQDAGAPGAINACNASPAREPKAITVGATTSTDGRSTFSNFGSCVDINAPGSSILGAYIPNPTSTATLSGTSMSSPLVAGAVANYLGFEPNATTAMVAEYISQKSTKNVISGLVTGTPNRLLYVPPDDNPISLSITPANLVTRSTSVSLTFTAGQNGIANFRVNGREIIGCSNITTSSEVAQCTWRPSRHGNNVVEVRLSPTTTSISSTTAKSLSVTVTPRTGSR